jgi:hypothetical protein
VSAKAIAQCLQMRAPRGAGAGEGIRTLDPNLGKVVFARPPGFMLVRSVGYPPFLSAPFSINGADLVLT